jgi:hypothetical protein
VTPDQLREYIAKMKLFALAARELKLPEEVIAEAALQSVTPFDKPLGECSDAELAAISDAADWKDVVELAMKKQLEKT